MVSVLFHCPSHYPVDRDKVVRAIDAALTGVVKRKSEVSVAIVGDRMMKSLNTKYRGKPKTTDVLSFPITDPSQPEKVRFVEPPDDILRLGDIVISYPQAVAEAAEDHVMVDEKIVELLLHGLDHLLGIHHDR